MSTEHQVESREVATTAAALVEPCIKVIEGGWRCVQPYHFPFVSIAKGRWIGKTLRQVLKDEFSLSDSYVDDACSAGRLFLRRAGIVIAKVDELLVHKDQITHIVHRHEPLVPDAGTIEWIPNSAEVSTANPCIVAVTKPTGLPVHAAGRYVHNTLHWIMKHQGLTREPLFACHRLDQCTSGVTVFAKSSSVAAAVNALLQLKMDKLLDSAEWNPHDGFATKTYVARVHGDFRAAAAAMVSTESTSALCAALASSPASPVAHCGHWSRALAKHALCVLDVDMVQLAGVNNRYAVAPAAPPTEIDKLQRQRSVTVFAPLAYLTDVDETVVLCAPLTGRTHQLRVHLSYLGHTIVGDAKYGSTALCVPGGTVLPPPAAALAAFPDSIDPSCGDCMTGVALEDADARNAAACLHALQYVIVLPGNGEKYTFETPLPTWARGV